MADGSADGSMGYNIVCEDSFFHPIGDVHMQQVKIFKGVDTEIPDLEKQINRFIRKTGVRILSITGNLASAPSTGGPMNSFAAGDILVIVMFEVDA